MQRRLDELAEGNRVGAYVLVRRLGIGGFGQVWLANRGDLGPSGVNLPAPPQSRVALKILSGAVGGPIDLVSEWYQGRQVSHPNVVRILDVGSDELLWFMAMEFIDGLTLRQLEVGVRRLGGRVPLDALIEVGIQAARGLGAVHDATDLEGRPLAMVHRDVKPDNLMLDRHGVVRLLDFGIAKGVDALALTQPNLAKGSPLWMAPEQHWADRLTPAADLFALATVLYELRIGQPLFSGATLDELVREKRGRHARDRLARDAELLGPLVPLLEGCTAPEPARRPQTAAEVEAELSRLLADFPRGPNLRELYDMVKDERVPATEQLPEEWASLAISLLGPRYPDADLEEEPTEGELTLPEPEEGPRWPDGAPPAREPKAASPRPATPPPAQASPPRTPPPAQASPARTPPPAQASPPRTPRPAERATPARGVPALVLEPAETGAEPAAPRRAVAPLDAAAEATWLVPLPTSARPEPRARVAPPAPAPAAPAGSGSRAATSGLNPGASPRGSSRALPAAVFASSIALGLLLVRCVVGGESGEAAPPVMAEAAPPVEVPDVGAPPPDLPPPAAPAAPTPAGVAQPERCDGIDSDGDGLVWTMERDLDQDGYAPCKWGTEAPADAELTQPFGAAATRGGDCRDNERRYYPGAKESEGDPDFNCDGSTRTAVDADGDGSPVGTDCDDRSPSVFPRAVEVPADGVDQNCDGFEVCYADNDGDGHGASDVGLVSAPSLNCSGKGISTDHTDCRDDARMIHPDAIEHCMDGLDNNCDLRVDFADAQCAPPKTATIRSARVDGDALRVQFDVPDGDNCTRLSLDYTLRGRLGGSESGSVVLSPADGDAFTAQLDTEALNVQTLLWSVKCVRRDGVPIVIKNGEKTLDE